MGGTLARTAWGGFLPAAQEIAEAGTFSRFEELPDVDVLRHSVALPGTAGSGARLADYGGVGALDVPDNAPTATDGRRRRLATERTR